VSWGWGATVCLLGLTAEGTFSEQFNNRLCVAVKFQDIALFLWLTLYRKQHSTYCLGVMIAAHKKTREKQYRGCHEKPHSVFITNPWSTVVQTKRCVVERTFGIRGSQPFSYHVPLQHSDRWACTPTTFQKVSICPFRISTDEDVPLKFLMTIVIIYS